MVKFYFGSGQSVKYCDFFKLLLCGSARSESCIEENLQVRPVQDLYANDPPAHHIEYQVPTLRREYQVLMTFAPGSRWSGRSIKSGTGSVSAIAAINDPQGRHLIRQIITFDVSQNSRQFRSKIGHRIV